MKKPFIKILLLGIVTFISVIPSNSIAQWAITNGPNGGVVNCFASSGSDYYAGLGNFEEGVYHSSNFGKTWQKGRGDLENVYISFIAVKGNSVFAGAEFGALYRSDDKGETWTMLQLYTSIEWSLYVSGNYIFAGIQNNSGEKRGMYISSNNGSSWDSINNGINNLNVYSINVTGSNLFIATNGGVFLSTNNGQNWISKNSGLTGVIINSFSISGDSVFAGSSNGIYRTINNGNNWQKISNTLLESSIRCISTKSPDIFAGTFNHGVFHSLDYGNTWQPFNNGLDNLFISSISITGNKVYVTNDNGLFESLIIVNNWDLTGVSTLNVRTFAKNGNVLFAGANDQRYGGVFSTTDNGNNWSKLNNGLSNVEVSGLLYFNNRLYAGTPSGIFLSTDNGALWNLVYTDSQGDYCFTTKGNDVFAGNHDRVIRSTNNGINWINLPYLTFGVEDIVVSGNNIFASNSRFVYRSTNDGANWSEVNNELGTYGAYCLAANGNKVFAGNQYGIYSTTNNGTNWIRSTNGLTDHQIYSLYVNNNIIYAGANYKKVYVSFDNGNTWIDRSEGFNYGYSYSIILSFIAFDNYIFSSVSENSVWRIPLSEIVGVNNISNQIPDKYSLKQNYPNPFNPTTNINYDLPNSNFVSLKVFDMNGKEIENLVNENQNAGSYSVTFNAANYPSGVYFYKLMTEAFSETKKMVLVK